MRRPWHARTRVADRMRAPLTRALLKENVLDRDADFRDAAGRR